MYWARSYAFKPSPTPPGPEGSNGQLGLEEHRRLGSFFIMNFFIKLNSLICNF
ncbi:MAG: hypothetical protein CH6_2113 [Candidatus Kapaibacterium sp.]|nr:MAG: hypothetical protein CH6_2113 [Candidatus Kapabacteria bacterium]